MPLQLAFIAATGGFIGGATWMALFLMAGDTIRLNWMERGIRRRADNAVRQARAETAAMQQTARTCQATACPFRRNGNAR